MLLNMATDAKYTFRVRSRCPVGTSADSYTPPSSHNIPLEKSSLPGMLAPTPDHKDTNRSSRKLLGKPSTRDMQFRNIELAEWFRTLSEEDWRERALYTKSESIDGTKACWYRVVSRTLRREDIVLETIRIARMSNANAAERQSGPKRRQRMSAALHAS